MEKGKSDYLSGILLLAFFLISFFMLQSMGVCENAEATGTQQMEVKRFTVKVPYEGSFLSENIYLAFDNRSKHGLIIDPGARSPEMEKTIHELGIMIKGILNTHGHADHTGANWFYRIRYRVGIYADTWDRQLYKNVANQPTRRISDGSRLQFGTIDIRIISTPGHTKGSVCFISGKHLFSGDTLFQKSIGRTADKASAKILIDNIKKKLLSLPPDTVVYPGHGETTTIGAEKSGNPFLQERLNI